MRAHYYTFLRGESFPWELPDYMTPIGMNGYVPKAGLAARQFIGDLDDDGRLGDLRGQLAVMALIQNMPDNDMVIVSHYRRFLVPRGSYKPKHNAYIGYKIGNGRELPSSTRIVSLEDFKSLDKSLLLTLSATQKFIMLPTPSALPKSVLDLHAAQHMIEDLVRIAELGVQQKIINGNFVAQMLSRDAMHIGMLYGAPAGFIKKRIAPIFRFAATLPKHLKHTRSGDHERYFAFALEVIVSEVFFMLRERYAEHITECDTLFISEGEASFSRDYKHS